MSKKSSMIVAGANCNGCKYFKLENNFVICSAKNKTYLFGAKIPCDSREISKK